MADTSRTRRLAAVADELAPLLQDSILVPEWPLGPLTTYRVGGSARLGGVVESMADLVAIAGVVARHDIDVVTVGRGSNLLVADAGFDGLALRLGEAFDHLVLPDAGSSGDLVVRSGAAASLPVLARQTVSAGLTGFEWAVGVPGSLGGAVAMNAGGHGADMDASVRSARVVDLGTGSSGVLDATALAFAYRSSAVTASLVVVEVDIVLEEGDPEAGRALLSDIVRWRRTHQPGGQNAGSVFTNPPGTSAGLLIDQAGLKGLRHGSAEVSTKHANFIQSSGGGSADDIVALMAEIQRRVFDDAGVWLHPETRLVGFSNPDDEQPGGEQNRSAT